MSLFATTVNRNLLPQNDWSVIGNHNERFYDRKNCARLVASACEFACFPDERRQDYVPKVQFSSVDDYPSCIKYICPEKVTFINNNPEFCGDKMTVLLVHIDSLINLNHAHFLTLHPIRYDIVKDAISRGVIDMPMVRLDDDGIPHVTDGRHRLVALLKFGFKFAEILTPEFQKDEVLRMLSSDQAKRRFPVELPEYDHRKRLSLDELLRRP